MKKNSAIILLFLSILALYVFTLYPACAPEDSGEYVAVSHILGIPHAPGNPLYVIAGRVFALIPLGNIAYRVNLMSAFFGVMSLVMLFFIVRLITANELAALAAAAFFAFTYEFWYTTTFAKTYTMLCFFELLALYFLLLWIKNSNNYKHLLLFCLTVGLGVSVHYFLLMFLPIMFIILIILAKQKRFRVITAGICLFLVGISVYLFLPFRAGADPVINAGRPDNLERFINVVTRREYTGIRMSAGAGSSMTFEDLYSRFKWMLLVFNDHFTTIGLLLGALGFFELFKKNRTTFTVIAVLFIICGPVWLILSAYPLTDPYKEIANERHLPAAECLFAVGIGTALSFLMKNIKRKVLLYSAIALFVSVPLLAHLKTVTKRDNFLCDDYGLNLFRTVEKNGILFAGQHINSFGRYLKYVRNKRRDITFVTSPSQFVRILQQYEGTTAPIYAEPTFALYSSDSVKGAPKGLALKFNPKISEEPSDEYEHIWPLYFYRKQYRSGTYKDFFSQVALNWYIEAFQRYGEVCINHKKYEQAIEAYKKCVSIGVFDSDILNLRTYNYGTIEPRSKSSYIKLFYIYDSMREYDSALRYAKTWSALDPEDAAAHYNTGVIYYRQALWGKAAAKFEKALEINPEMERAKGLIKKARSRISRE